MIGKIKTATAKLQGKTIVFSFLAMLAMSCRMECIAGIKESFLLNAFYKIYSSFCSYNFSDVFLFLFVYMLIKYVDSTSEVLDRITLFVSIMLSALYVVSMSYKNYDNLDFVLGGISQIVISGICIIGFSVLFYYSIRFVEIYLEKHEYRGKTSVKNIGLLSFVIIFLCWFPWIIMNYPGSIGGDAQSQLRQYFGISEFTSHHPPLSTWIMGTLAYIGRMFADINFGIFLYPLLHTFLGALIFALCIKKLSQMGVGTKYCILMVVFFASPLWGGAAQYYNKDLLYVEVFCLFSMYLMDIIWVGHCTLKNALVLGGIGLLTSLLRNNGIYTIVPTLFVLALGLKNIDRKRVCGVLCATLVLYFGIVSIIYPLAGITKGSVKEMLSIPFLQTARYVNTYEDEVTEYEREIIDSVLEYDALVNYHPKQADSIKNTYKHDNSKLPEYFKVWFEMFLKHPWVYIDAFLNKAAANLAPVEARTTGSFGYIPENFSSQMGITYPFQDRYLELFVEIDNFFMELPPFELLYMAGTYTWVMLVCIVLLVRKKIYRGIILFVPGIMNVLICIASPAWEIRYAMPLMAVTPLYVGWTWYMILVNKQEDKQVVK